MAQIETSKQLYLVSGSPRRKELLQQIGLTFDVLDAPIDEAIQDGERPEEYVKRIAIEKALAGAGKSADEHAWYIGGDTSVIVDGQVLGKPEDVKVATEMLGKLSGREHSVLSAVSILHGDHVYAALNRTQVKFKALSAKEIQDYVLSGEPMGKAGSYAIQGTGACFIESIHGSYSAVMGLPLFELNDLLLQSGYKE